MAIKMILLPQYQRRSTELLPELRQAGYDFLLQNQQDHYQALATAHIVINTNQTGTGKTLASLLHLLRKEMQDADSGNTLIIAPTNELISQHADDVQQFVTSQGLPHIVIRVHAGIITEIAKEPRWRRGEAFYELLRNPRNAHIAPHLGVGDKINERRPIILVTNPDLFYCILQGRFRHLDRRNLITELIGRFRYIIIDEFHYYSPKQAAAFFLYIALLAQFGFFTEGCRMTFLTATPEPEIDLFFQKLATLGLQIVFIPPQPVKAMEESATMSTTTVALQFESSDEGIDGIVSNQVDAIRVAIAQGRDVAIISHSLADISAAATCFRKSEYQTITGAVSAILRREASHANLILATPTVDIGYNFSRTGKDRQGLDDIYFTARYMDEFWQRLGRVGRVVKKAEQHVTASALCVVDAKTYQSLQSLQLQGKSLDRATLETILKENGIFPPRADFWNYLVTEGFFENGQALKRLAEVFTIQERHNIEKVHDFLANIFAIRKPPSWRQIQARLIRYQSLSNEEEKCRKNQPQFPDKLLREFAADLAKRKENTTSTEGEIEQKVVNFSKQELVNFQEYLTKKNNLQLYYDYIYREFKAIDGIFTFRNIFSGIPVVAYDKDNIFHPKQHIVFYDVLHLMKHYYIEPYVDQEQFLRDISSTAANEFFQQEPDEEIPLYVRIKGIRERKDRLRLRFQISVDNLTNFEKLDTDCVRAFGKIKLGFTKSDGIHRNEVPVYPQLQTIMAELYIPMLVFSERTWIKLAQRVRAAGFIPTEVAVFDSTLENTRIFQALVGTAAYYIARAAAGLRSAMERYESFYIC
ncbi:MAG: type I-D CRISPR-associated helicase Cas3' [Acidobacteriota bacterium]